MYSVGEAVYVKHKLPDGVEMWFHGNVIDNLINQAKHQMRENDV